MSDSEVGVCWTAGCTGGDFTAVIDVTSGHDGNWEPLFEHWWFLGHGSRRRWGCWGLLGAGSGELLRLRGTHAQWSFS